MTKRILAILAAVLVLATALAVPAFAECAVHEAITYGDNYDGTHYVYCNDCGWQEQESHEGYFDYIDDDYHSWSCEKCEYVETFEHEYASGIYVVTEPTCGMENGLAANKYCFLCGFYDDTYLFASAYTNHDYRNGVCVNCGLTSDGSCDHEIVNTFISQGMNGHSVACNNCGEVLYNESHLDYNTVIQEATYSQPGIMNHYCSRCEYNYTTTFTLEEHEHIYGASVFVDVDRHKQECTICKKPFYNSHMWDDGKVTRQPTANQNGIRTFTCKSCNGTKTESIDYVDFDKLLADMTKEEATELFNKIFDKYKGDLVENGVLIESVLDYFARVIVRDIKENGINSCYYIDYITIYRNIRDVFAMNDSVAYAKGYEDAIGAVIDENPVQGLFQGMWSSTIAFITVLGEGISIGGINLMSFLITVFVMLVVWFILKLVGKG